MNDTHEPGSQVTNYYQVNTISLEMDTDGSPKVNRIRLKDAEPTFASHFIRSLIPLTTPPPGHQNQDVGRVVSHAFILLIKLNNGSMKHTSLPSSQFQFTLYSSLGVRDGVVVGLSCRSLLFLYFNSITNERREVRELNKIKHKEATQKSHNKEPHFVPIFPYFLLFNSFTRTFLCLFL